MTTSQRPGSGTAQPARSGRRSVKRYHVVTETLRREIQAGHYPVGTDLPTEGEICERFEVSRFTAREALRRLEEAGFIVRRQGAGNRVVSREPAVRYLASIGSQDDVLRYARDTTLVTDGSWVPATPAHVTDLDLGTERDWLHVNGVRRAGVNGSAIGFTEVWVLADLDPYLPLIDPSHSDSIFAQLSSAADLLIQQIQQEIYSTALAAGVARGLGTKTGSPALVVVRRYFAPDLGCFEVARTTHPADRFRYNLTLVNAATSTLAGPTD